jgi:hypothetical protein
METPEKKLEPQNGRKMRGKPGKMLRVLSSAVIFAA